MSTNVTLTEMEMQLPFQKSEINNKIADKVCSKIGSEDGCLYAKGDGYTDLEQNTQKVGGKSDIHKIKKEIMVKRKMLNTQYAQIPIIINIFFLVEENAFAISLKNQIKKT